MPLIVHATKQILDTVGRGRLGARPGGARARTRQQLVAYLKRPRVVSGVRAAHWRSWA